MADGAPQDAIGHALPKPKRPFGRSLADFRIEGATTPNGLHPAEERLLDCAARGEECGIAPVRPEKATPENTVRGLFLRFLLLGGDAEHPVHESDLELQGAFVDGDINLESTDSVRSFALYDCDINGWLVGLNARLGKVNLSGTYVVGVDCDGARIAGHVILREGFRADKEVSFLGAEASGQLDCSGGEFGDTEDNALNCEGAKIAGNVFLRDGFAAAGKVNLLGAEIGGLLICSGGSFKASNGAALDCYGIQVRGDVRLQEGFAAEGEVRFARAKIGGQFECGAGIFRNPGGYGAHLRWRSNRGGRVP